MRTACLMLICLFLGAVATVSVSWRCVVNHNPYWGGERTSEQIDTSFGRVFVIATEIFGVHHLEIIEINASESQRFLLRSRRSIASANATEGLAPWARAVDLDDWISKMDLVSEHVVSSASIVSSGWPFRAMITFSGAPDGLSRGIPPHRLKVRCFLPFPVRPLPLGFAANTAIYGSFWLGLLAGPGFARRRLRAWRGFCRTCGYDMRSSDGVCSECGS